VEPEVTRPGAQNKMRIILKKIFKLTLLLIGCLALYLIAAFIFPYIPVNSDYKDSLNGVKIYVLSNGVHTDIVVPAKTKYKDWTIAFPKDSFEIKDSAYYYIGFGWGDKGFYLYTPEWKDLKISTALKATCGLGGTAMHVHYAKERRKENDRCQIFMISEEQYKKLITCIENGFEKKENDFIKISHPGYGYYDRFYEANGNYSLFKTCNVWTNNTLKETGIKTGLWTPFSAGLMSGISH
jgi:uncharacterized protein (TIGR02117 family)